MTSRPGSAAAVLLVLLLVVGDQTCAFRRGSVVIENNAYRNLVIAVASNVPENPLLLNRIQEEFTAASAFLYQVTRRRAYFGDITILLPETWTGNYELSPLEGRSYDQSDIVVDGSYSWFGPSVVHFAAECGVPGYYMQTCPDYFLQEEEAIRYGSYAKVLVHEWSHLRYGVFDEYPIARDDPMAGVYRSSQGTIQATKCSSQLTGRFLVRGGLSLCDLTNATAESVARDCSYVDDINQDGEYASIMYRQFLNHLVGFCDNEDSDLRLLHNIEAPNRQNKRCDFKSIWEVLREHDDFRDANFARDVASTAPAFRLARLGRKRTVLVLDISASMHGDRLLVQQQSCINYIRSFVEDGEYVGIIHFTDQAYVAHNLTEVTDETRERLVGSVHGFSQDGLTSIGAGIRLAVSLLDQDDSAAGGTIIVFSDGKQNSRPYIDDTRSVVLAMGIRLHAIALSNWAEPQLDELARVSGGMVFLHSDVQPSNDLIEAFQRLSELSNNDSPAVVQHAVSSHATTQAQGQQDLGSIVIDETVGKSTEIIVEYNGIEGVEVGLRAPNGSAYDLVSEHCERDSINRIVRCRMQGVIEPGEWQYNITSRDVDPQRVGVLAVSKARSETEKPLHVQAILSHSSIQLSRPTEAGAQRIYAIVSRGDHPVLGANVTAVVEPESGEPMSVALLDTGAGADLAQDDGVYSAFFVQYSSNGRHSVKVLVSSLPRSRVILGNLVGTDIPEDMNALQTERDVEQEISLAPFQRVTTAGSFHVVGWSMTGPNYPPGRITDLQVDRMDDISCDISLSWTAPGHQLDYGRASSYEIRWGHVRNLTEDYGVIDANSVLQGNLSNPQEAGRKEYVKIRISSKDNITYFLAVHACDMNGRDVFGPASNLLRAHILDRSLGNTETTVVPIQQDTESYDRTSVNTDMPEIYETVSNNVMDGTVTNSSTWGPVTIAVISGCVCSLLVLLFITWFCFHLHALQKRKVTGRGDLYQIRKEENSQTMSSPGLLGVNFQLNLKDSSA